MHQVTDPNTTGVDACAYNLNLVFVGNPSLSTAKTHEPICLFVIHDRSHWVVVHSGSHVCARVSAVFPGWVVLMVGAAPPPDVDVR